MHGPRARVEIGSFLLSFIARAPAGRRAEHRGLWFFPPLELRVDAIDVRSAESGTLHAGLGTNLPLGSYMRLEIVGAGGISRHDSVNHEGGRFDVLARFLLDPF